MCERGCERGGERDISSVVISYPQLKSINKFGNLNSILKLIFKL